MPDRIQRRRTRGWRMPPGAVYVGRPSRWGNPYLVEQVYGQWTVFDSGPSKQVRLHGFANREEAARKAVSLYRRWIDNQFRSANMISLLGGHDLACWCPLLDAAGGRMPCHADVLLELANR